MSKTRAPRAARDYGQLRQICGLGERILLVDLDETILWANTAALVMHGVDDLTDLGTDITEYRKRFRLTYRNNHPIREGRFRNGCARVQRIANILLVSGETTARRPIFLLCNRAHASPA